MIRGLRMFESVQPWLALNIPPDRISLDWMMQRLREVTYKYKRPSLEDIASPAVLEALKDAAKEDTRIEELMQAWVDDKQREAMQEWGINYILKLCRYQLSTENTIYTLLYGAKGTGKTEIAQFLTLLEMALYFEIDIAPILGMARSPSVSNDILSRATLENQTLLLIDDETEHEFNMGSAKALIGLIQNADTMRVLRHSLTLCTISLDYLGGLISRCDIILHAIFADRKNRVNWCILYTNSLETRENKTRLTAKAIVGLPLHEMEDLRSTYKTWKEQYQTGLTISGGAHGADSTVIDQKAYLLVEYAKNHGYTDYSAHRLEEILYSEIPGGKDMVGKQLEFAAIKARRLLDDDSEPKDDPKPPEIIWTSDFSWAEEIERAIKKHPQFKKYHDVFLATEIMHLNTYRDADAFEKITGQKKTQNGVRLKRMKEDDEFQGWLKQTRSQLHEKFIAHKLREAGWTVQEKPHFELGGVDYEEDLYAENDGHAVWLNCKCGSGNRTYLRNDYVTTYILANQTDAEAFIIYSDLQKNTHDIFLPAERFSVGSHRSTLTEAKNAGDSDSSTPLSLLAALKPKPIASEPGTKHRAPTRTRAKTKTRSKRPSKTQNRASMPRKRPPVGKSGGV
jgi:hypothetical protein